MTNQNLSRRDVLKLIGLGAGAVTFGGIISACSPYLESIASATSFPTSTLVPDLPASADLDITLRATKGQVNIFPDAPTDIWHYAAEVNQGDPASVQSIPNSYLGPILHLQRGQNFRARLVNELTEETIIHWHGLRLPAEMDGHPRYAVSAGKSYEYEFPVINRAGTYWFHPHPHQLTGAQVYYGLAGLFIVSDEEESALGLPAGDYDLPLVIQDRTFDSQNQMVYLANGMMDQMIGFLGDTILVNGAPNVNMEVKASAYRLRLLNGSNSRIYKLAWQDGTPLTVIATDGGLLEKPVTRAYITLGPGERIELWMDFSSRAAGSEMKLVSLPFSDFSGGMGGGMMGGGSSLPNGAALDILRLKIGEKGANVVSLPARLSTIERYSKNDAVNRNNPRSFTLAMQGMIHTINNHLFEMEAVAQDEIVRLGDLEVWEFVNLEGGRGMGMGMMNMEMPHPMHIHGVQFQILERLIARQYEAIYGELSDGFVDDGWKDTVLVMPGERVRVLVRFADYAGTYLYHCHNLEHEDGGMMRNYRVEG